MLVVLQQASPHGRSAANAGGLRTEQAPDKEGQQRSETIGPAPETLGTGRHADRFSGRKPRPRDRAQTIASVRRRSCSKARASGQCTRQTRGSSLKGCSNAPFGWNQVRVAGLPRARTTAIQILLPELLQQERARPTQISVEVAAPQANNSAAQGPATGVERGWSAPTPIACQGLQHRICSEYPHLEKP